MRKTTLFTFAKPSENATMFSHRIARFVSEETGLPIHWNDDVRTQRPDVLVLFAGGVAFCSHLASIAEVIERAPRIVWVCNDHMTRVPTPDGKGQSPFRRAFALRKKRGLPHVDYWSTVREHAESTPGGQLVCWNKLAYDPIDQPPELRSAALIYYGSYRRDRLAVLDELFSRPRVRTVISNASGRFEERYPLCEHVGSLERPLSRSLQAYGSGLYVEDADVTHGKWRVPPACRFYEMLGAGLPIVVHSDGVVTLSDAGYDVTQYTCRTPSGVAELVRRRREIAEAQRTWRRDYRAEVREDLRRAVRTL